jgi:HD-GYP domain-containing protein (c-di-GMP phosphodiesterase class II)
VLARYGGEEFALLVPNASPDELSGIAERLRSQVASSPIVASPDTWVAVTISVGTASYPLHGEDPGELVSIADRALYAAKASGRDRIVVGASTTPPLDGLDTDHLLVDYLSQIADRVDGWLSSYEHSSAIGRWSTLLALELGLGAAAARCAELSGRLHDIGKIVIPEAVLTKPGALSDEEWQLVRQHPDFGFRLARMIPGYSGIAQVIRQHHERYDGLGYPDRLAARDIRIESRVLAVCDSWAAMRADRPYQSALSEDQAREELRAGRGTQFDPDIADLFLDLHHRGLVGDLQRIRPEQDASGGLVLPQASHPTPGT